MCSMAHDVDSVDHLANHSWLLLTPQPAAQPPPHRLLSGLRLQLGGLWLLLSCSRLRRLWRGGSTRGRGYCCLCQFTGLAALHLHTGSWHIGARQHRWLL